MHIKTALTTVLRFIILFDFCIYALFRRSCVFLNKNNLFFIFKPITLVTGLFSAQQCFKLFWFKM